MSLALLPLIRCDSPDHPAGYDRKGPCEHPRVPYLSPSSAKTLLTCPAKWLHRRTRPDVPDPQGLNAMVGTAVHTALETAMKAKLDGVTMAGPELQQAGQDALTALIAACRANPLEPLAKEDDDPAAIALAMDRVGPLAVGLWSDLLKAGCEPVAVEGITIQHFEGAGWASLGYFDLLVRVNGKLAVIDFKTSTRSPNGGKATADDAFQILRYADSLRANGQPVEQAFVLYVVDLKGGVKVVWAEVPVTPQTCAWAQGLHHTALDVVRRGAFDPNPIAADYLCTARFCPAWGECPGAWRA